MSKVLILGSDGMLGSALTDVFKNRYEAVPWDLKDLDITKREEVFKKIKDVRPELIINSAAYNAVDKIENDEKSFELANLINNKAVGYLGEVSEFLNCSLIHFSTDYIFPGDDKNGYKEEAEPKPINKYGESKLEGEISLKKQTDKFYIFRLSRLFGPAGKSASAKKSFVDSILEKYIAEEKVLIKLVNEEVSCPTFSLDLAQTVIDSVQNSIPFGVYHTANIGSCTWFEFGKEVFKIKNLNPSLIAVSGEEFNRAAKRPAFSELINTKLPQMRSWQEALKDYLK